MTAAFTSLFAHAAVSAALAVHPQHVSLADAEWNAKSRSLEVTLSLTAAQLETAVEAHARADVRLEDDAANKAVAAWLKDRVFFTPPAKPGEKEEDRKPAALKYVGRETENGRAYIYFEAPLPGGWEGVTASSLVGMAREPAQHNTLVLNVTRPGPGGEPRKERATYEFTRRSPAAVLRAADLEPLKKTIE